MQEPGGILRLNAVKDHNRRALLRELYLGGPLSRVELARRLRCDGTTITRGVRALLERGLVVEGGADQSGQGRPRTLLLLNAPRLKAVGVELGPGKIAGVVADLSGKALVRDQVRFALDVGGGELLGFLGSLAGRLLAEVAEEERLGVGVAVFGHFHRGSRIIETAAGFPAIERADIERSLGDTLKLKPEIVNSTLALAQSQPWFREGPGGVRLMVRLGHGIGSVLAIDGKPFASPDGHPGEFGHTVCDLNGELCPCGRRGCLETVASIPALLRHAAAAGRPVDFAAFCREWPGDPALEGIVAAAVAHLAAGIGNLIHVAMPAKLVLCGETLALGDAFVARLKAALEAQVIPPLRENLEIAVAAVDDYSVSLGAASTIIRDYFGR